MLNKHEEMVPELTSTTEIDKILAASAGELAISARLLHPPEPDANLAPARPTGVMAEKIAHFSHILFPSFP